MHNDNSGPKLATGVNSHGESFDSKFTDLVIRLIVVGLFAYLSLTLLAPFGIMAIWAVILAVALYPAYAALRDLLGGRGRLAAALITLLGLVIIIGPLGAVTVSFADVMVDLLARFGEGKVIVPKPHEEVRNWPVIGERASSPPGAKAASPTPSRRSSASASSLTACVIEPSIERCGSRHAH